MSLTPGKAFSPVLAHPSKGIEDVLKRFGKEKFTCEWKYDGERIQIHRTKDGNVHMFSRTLINNTARYPDVADRMAKCVKDSTKDFIADAEVVAWDADKHTILPFQTLSTRKRKVNGRPIKVQVVLFLFDLIYVNGKSIADKPLSERRKILQERFFQVPDSVFFVTSMDTSDPKEIGAFLQEAVRGYCEGLMLKTLSSTYDVGRRSRHWLKLKKDYLDGLGDTLDLVVIAGYNGEGKRAGVYGAYLMAVYDPKDKEYHTLCKVGTGFTDAVLKKQHKEFGKMRVKQPLPEYNFHRSLIPDAWFKPQVVWEIKAYGLTLSNRHCACQGLIEPSKGFSLRFPRFIRVRDDKTIEQATTPEQIAEMHKRQEDVGGFVYSHKNGANDEEEEESDH